MECWFCRKWDFGLLFVASRSIAGWYTFSFFTDWFLNQYHSFFSFNHNYSDT